MIELTGRIPSMSLAVVGAPYANKDGSDRLFEILLCKPGEQVELRPEPKNKKDERAIAVLSARGVQIGYITAERAPRIGALIRSGREVQSVFQARSEWGAWIRVAFDGEMPVVTGEEPPVMSRLPRLVAAEHDFYPDEEWPESFE